MSDSLSTTFAALADPTRRAIIAKLGTAERLAVGVLAEPASMSLTGVLKHVRVLTDAGLVMREKEGRTVYCRLTPGPMANAADWLTQTHAYWSSRLDALAAIVEEDACKPEPKRTAGRTSAPGSSARSGRRPRRSSARGRKPKS